MHSEIKLSCLMPLSQSATSYFRRWLTDDNDKWFIVDWLFDVTHAFDVRLKKEKIKHKQTWMNQALARKWKFFIYPSLFKGTVCHYWCDIGANLHVSCTCWGKKITFYSKMWPNIHISFCWSRVPTCFNGILSTLSLFHTHKQHDTLSKILPVGSAKEVCVSLVNKKKGRHSNYLRALTFLSGSEQVFLLVRQMCTILNVQLQYRTAKQTSSF